MVDKRSGQVDYAVLTFGGLFGMGGDYYPLPWDALSYDSGQGGYVIELDKAQLENAPRYEHGNDHAFDRAFGDRVNSYYGVDPAL